ncbi:hypothetical protein A2380_01825 [candidate division WWE3 bacterium RIFOXYB1_FULL_43_24]|uniref:Uncharacterized protein n=1 Tax=candidate division WWE3 bacterium GW2011_GWF1_42_14 TaxID=1619138 RepID=A0A0G0YPQ4_UNCKA|nr:MAG: hypothetical protein UU92_C0002G0040 [candidate division WWE3 bacterium GW2011_GWA1_42_12]KKS34925.1 MAG: hypothetical protein UU97_C0004G0011 [candidate division WWE3 bacterium GW2011_GWD1_42_14]KKS38642.1 MAG: hypothetical protein UV00_C0006G0040 [candidate division WWE3 bacterium GW2011_GWF1_42_14]KKS40405.1 MAG: hypothetical protein UV03_C0007G0040 [candidate division WWE3 bacterium GW2011_GWE1_42_16]OGC59092.1 MAG: hypothetical protein A2212_02280 [candidate division WWE3 bacterium
MRRLFKRNPQLIDASGFTLIELLLVIVIIGILSGIVIAVINPAQVRRRSAETVMRANTDKVCYAMQACAATRLNPEVACITFEGISATQPNGNPTGSVYGINYSTPPNIVVTGTASGTNPCVFSCSYNVTQGTASATSGNANCLAL